MTWTLVLALGLGAYACKVIGLVVMGGTSDHRGNITAVAEYNVWADPEAAGLVFESGAPITMVGWDISRRFAVITPSDADGLRSLGPLGAWSVDIQRTLVEFCREHTLLYGFDLPDPIAMAIAPLNIAAVLSKRGVQVLPLFLVFQAPPPADER